jgi:protein-disulfide isomerase
MNNKSDKLPSSEKKSEVFNLNKNLTIDGITLPHLINILMAIVIIFTTVYLTRHYWDVNFGFDIKTGSLCDISAFFNCDSATHSKLASVFNIPTSVFGLMFGFSLMIGSIFPSVNFERTNKFLSLINLIGCIGLFAYSLIALGSLCPMCTAYYVFSAIVFFLYWKFSGLSLFQPDVKSLALLAAIFLVLGGTFSYTIGNKKEKMSKDDAILKKSLVEQYKSLPKVSVPEYQSPHFILKTNSTHQEAPLRVMFFSDFQCPACERLSPVLEKFKKKYDGKISIQYYFFPLDSNCNKDMQRQLHPQACLSSFIAHCSGERFVEVHDHFFKNQSSMSDQWLEEYAKANNWWECSQSPETREAIQAMLKTGKGYSIQGTPTMFVNESRITRALNEKMYEMIFDSILETK